MIPSRTLPIALTPLSGVKKFSGQEYQDEIALLLQTSISSLNSSSSNNNQFTTSFTQMDTKLSANTRGRLFEGNVTNLPVQLPSTSEHWIKLLDPCSPKIGEGSGSNIPLGTGGLNFSTNSLWKSLNINSITYENAQSASLEEARQGRKMLGREIGMKNANPEGFRLLTYKEKANLFGGKRDDLFYKTFVRDVRKFWEDNFSQMEMATSSFSKEKKDKKGIQFYSLLQQYEESLQLSSEHELTSEEIVCYLGSLINHREFIKACPKHLKKLSDNIHYVFTKFTKERLYNLWKTPQFKVLFRGYVDWVNKSEDFERLRTHRTIGKNLAPYMIVYNEFVRVWITNE